MSETKSGEVVIWVNSGGGRLELGAALFAKVIRRKTFTAGIANRV